jgi:hypothetical protein
MCSAWHGTHAGPASKFQWVSFENPMRGGQVSDTESGTVPDARFWGLEAMSPRAEQRQKRNTEDTEKTRRAQRSYDDEQLPCQPGLSDRLRGSALNCG